MDKERIIELTNEKGNVKAQVRKLITKDLVEDLEKRFLQEDGYQVKNTVYVQIGVDKRTNKQIMVEYKPTIKIIDPNAVPEKEEKPVTYYKATN